LEESIKRLTDAQIQAKTGFFKERLGQGAELDDILPEPSQSPGRRLGALSG